MSVPFVGKEFTFTQPDGTKIRVRGWGDQHSAVFESEDGYTLTKDPATGFWVVAELSPDGASLAPVAGARTRADGGRAGVRRGLRIDPAAARANARDGARWLGGRRCDERRRERRAAVRAARAAVAAGGPAPAPPQRTTVGDYVGLCLLVDFDDEPSAISRDEVERFCNLPGYSGFGNNGSVRDYFHDNSGGRLRYTNVVAPWYRARNPKSYYTDRNVEMGVRARELIREALTHWKSSGFDFSPLTADGAGKVYATNVFYSGPVVNDWSEGLWPHAWMLGAPFALRPGMSAFDYQFTAMGSELLLGTFCHENGHMLCDYPDLYDYGNQSAGVGMFCLMCAGNHADQRNPVQISGYLKRLSGWADRTVHLEHGAQVSLRAGANEFAILTKDDDEYFLVENRAKSGRDAALPDAGLAIWHVDEDGDNGNEQMTAALHYELSLEQADGLFELERSRNEPGDANDLWSGASARFADGTTPSSRWWDGTSSHLSIDQVSAAGATMSFRCTFSNVSVPPSGGKFLKESLPARPIPDEDPAGISDTIQVPGPLTIADLRVTVDVSHTYRGDLQVTLVAPWGASVILHPKNQGGSADGLQAAYDPGTVPALAAWRGHDAKGAWRLEVRDLAPADVGRLERWSLAITPASPPAGPVVLEESPGVVIPDHPAAGIERRLTAAGPGAVRDVQVDVDVTHTYIGDLRIALVSPAGTVVPLHDRTGAQADNIVATYTPATTAPLAGLAGQAIAGDWRLRVSDHEAADVGKLNRWRVTIRPVG